MTTATTTASRSPRIARTFADLRAAGRIGLMPFVPAGFPDTQTTAETLRALQDAGASAVEIGIPFSDPIADGPVIQAAFTAALARGLKLKDVLAAVASVRPAITIPLIGMVSYSIVYRTGVQRFATLAADAGFDGLILPDLPPPEADAACATLQSAGLDTTLLVAPTTTPARRTEIARLSSGFIYYLSVAGITGERKDLPPELAAGLANMRALTDRPICVGFGVSTPQHVSQLKGHADGAIVGSALVRRMTDQVAGGPAAVAKAAAGLCRDLLAGVR